MFGYTFNEIAMISVLCVLAIRAFNHFSNYQKRKDAYVENSRFQQMFMADVYQAFKHMDTIKAVKENNNDIKSKMRWDIFHMWMSIFIIGDIIFNFVNIGTLCLGKYAFIITLLYTIFVVFASMAWLFVLIVGMISKQDFGLDWKELIITVVYDAALIVALVIS